MSPESFLKTFNAALDAIAQQGFDFGNAQNLLPSGRLLSTIDRLEVVRGFDLERPEFNRKVDLEAVAKFDVANEVEERDEAMAGLIQELLGVSPTREKLVALGIDKWNAKSPPFELRDGLRADLESNDILRMIRAIRHLPIGPEEISQLIRKDLAEMPHEFRKWQLAHRLENYQAAKSHLAGAWFSTTILYALNYAGGVPTRDLVIAGLAGLAKGIEKFDSQRGYEFGLCITWWVRQAVTRAVIDLRGWTINEVETLSAMRKLIGEDRWSQWVRSPNPKDVSELGLDDQTVIGIIERGMDKTIYPIHLKGSYLTPECAGGEREWFQLSENVTSDTNPLWWV
jgi:hypothetical protein